MTLTGTGTGTDRQGSVVTGLRGCSISSYLLANLGLLLTNTSVLNLLFKCCGGFDDGGGSGEQSDSSDEDSSASEGSTSEKAGE